MQQTPEIYLRILNAMEEAFVLIELIRDTEGAFINFKYLEANPAFEKQVAHSRDEIIGNTVLNLLPDLDPYWIQRFGKVADSGESMRFERHLNKKDQWYEGFAYAINSDQVAVLFRDITARKQAEVILQENERWKAYLLQLSDALRPLSDPVAIQQMAINTLGEHLKADRVLYAELTEDGKEYDVTVNYVSECTSERIGRFSTKAFPSMSHLYSYRVVNDVNKSQLLTDAEKKSSIDAGILAVVGVPLVKEGHIVAQLGVQQSQPREWTSEEVLLIEQTAERTWSAVERAKAEKKLRQSEEKYRSLFQSLDECYIVGDVIPDEKGKPVDILFLEANKATLQLAGRELAGITMRQINPDFEQHWFDFWGKVAKTGISERREYYAAPVQCWYNIYAFKIGGPGENRVAALFTDITQRKQHEQRQEFLLKLSDKLRLKSDPVAIEQTITQIATEQFQCDRCYYCQVEGDKVTILRDAAKEGLPSLAGVYSMRELPIFKSVVDAGKPIIINDITTSRSVDEPLRQFCIQWQLISFIDVPVIKNNIPVGILCIVGSKPRPWTAFEVQLAKELAERTSLAVEGAKDRETLRLSEEMKRIALHSAAMGTWNWEVEQDILELDGQNCQLLGLPVKQVKNNIEFFLQLVHPEDRQRVKDELNKAPGQGIYHSEFRVKREDNQKVRWMNVYAGTVSSENNRATRMVGVMHDITGRKKLERQKDDFIGIASHELKTPLTSMKIYTQLLSEIFREKNDQTGVSFMQKLDGQLDRITGLVTSLLDVTRLEEGNLKLDIQSFDMNELISRQIIELRHLSGNHHLLFKPGRLEKVRADKERIAQVITNLITNAVKYSPGGGDVLITSEEAGDGVKVTVLDTGMGIPDELQGKVFDRFYRINNPEVQTFPGMGIGLYIARGIIRRHKGKIGLKSHPGKGSEFYFIIPYGN